MASSADLITLIANGTFTVLPNRTIAIDRPTIEPSSIPVPVRSEFIPTPTSTSSPFLLAPAAENHDHNDTLRTALLAGIFGSIVLCLIFTFIFRYRTAILAKRHNVKFNVLFTWGKLTPPALPAQPLQNPRLPVNGTGPTAKWKGKMPIFSLSKPNVPANVGTRLNKKGQVEYYCLNHNCPIDPNTGICEESGEVVGQHLRTKKKPKGPRVSGHRAGPSMSQV